MAKKKNARSTSSRTTKKAATKKTATRKAAPRKKATKKKAAAKKAATKKTRPSAPSAADEPALTVPPRPSRPSRTAAAKRPPRKRRKAPASDKSPTLAQLRKQREREREDAEAEAFQRQAERKRQYDEHRDRNRRNQAAKSRAGREIGLMPPVLDPDRRETCRHDLEKFAHTYFPNLFKLKPSPAHKKVWQQIQAAVLEGGQFALAMPRASGKTTMCIVAIIWRAAYSTQRVVLKYDQKTQQRHRFIIGVSSASVADSGRLETGNQRCHERRPEHATTEGTEKEFETRSGLWQWRMIVVRCPSGWGVSTAGPINEGALSYGLSI